MRLCVFGDSFVNGTGDDSGLGWVGRVVSAARCSGRDLTAYDLGVRGDTSQDVLLRWHEEATRRLRPEHNGFLIFSFGANDCALDITTGKPCIAQQQSVVTAEAILAQAQMWLPTLMMGPGIVACAPEATSRILELSARYSDLCSRLSVPYLEIATLLLNAPAWHRESLAGDGAHPNYEGYAVVANMVQNWKPWQAWF